MTTLHDHPDLRLAEKQTILKDWAHFIASGFKLESLTDKLFDFLFVGFWSRQLPYQFYGQGYSCMGRKSKVAFWQYYFKDDLDLFKRVLQEIVELGIDPRRHGGRLYDEATNDIDLAVARLLIQHYDRILAVFADHSTDIVDHLIAEQIEQIKSLNPTFNFAELMPHNQAVLIPSEAMTVTDKLRGRLAQAPADSPRQLNIPSLFAIRPAASLLPPPTNASEAVRQTATRPEAQGRLRTKKRSTSEKRTNHANSI